MKNTFSTVLLVFVLMALPIELASQTTNLISYNIKYDNTGDTINNWNDRKHEPFGQIECRGYLVSDEVSEFDSKDDHDPEKGHGDQMNRNGGGLSNRVRHPGIDHIDAGV